ncbi:MAG: hypothetical protein JSR29_20200 [Nitrospira sp.]|nr:hypothetical protein [Nitrospira sp.]
MPGSRTASPQFFYGKLAASALPNVLKRPRLLRQLDQARAKPIIWLMGPPGAGKTTLVASYLQLRKLPSLWYQLDEGDADIGSFFHYLGLAVKRAAPRYRRPLPHLTPEYRASLMTFTRRFFDELFSRLKPPFVLVFDHYHEVPIESQLHDVLSVALDTVPDGITWIFISRAHPPIAVARLQARQVLHVFEPDALRLTPEEATQLVRLQTQSQRDQPSTELIEQIHAKTAGWVAGMILMLKSDRMDELANSILDVETPEIIFDYLAREALSGIPQETQNFLFKTASLPTMTVAVAERLTGLPTAERILKRLYETRQFTERRLQDGRVLYQYHPLFRQFLLRQAREAFSPKQLKSLQCTAALLLEETGQIESAIELLQIAGDTGNLLRVLLQNAPELFQQGRSQTLTRWLNTIPSPLLEQMPWALFWLGACTSLVNHYHGQQLLERAFAGFEAQGDQVGMLSAGCATVESIMVGWVNMPQLGTWVDRLQGILSDGFRIPSPELEARITFATFMAEMWRRPNAHLMSRLMGQVETFLKRNPEPIQRMLVGCFLVSYKAWLGHLDEVANLLALLRKPIPVAQLPPLAIMWFKAAESTHAFLTAEHDHCLEEVEQGWHIATHYGLEAWSFSLLANGTYGALLTNDLDAAQAYLDKLRLLPDHLGLCNHIAGWMAFVKRDIYEARRQAESALKHVLESLEGSSFPEALNRFALAQVLYEQRNHDEAEHHLARARQVGKEMNSSLLEYMCSLLQASLAFGQSQEENGLQSLRHAMVLGRTRGFVNFPWWSPSLMARLCAKALEVGIEIEYVQFLIRKRRLCPDPPSVEVADWPWGVKIHTLGHFNLVVDGKPVRFSRKAQQRPLELLQALIAFGGQEVAEATLTDALWPDAEGDAAHEAFSVTLHRLRKLIGTSSLELKGGRLSLSRQHCYVDVWAFERLLEQADAAVLAGDHQASHRFHEKAFALYAGPFLNDYAASWVQPLREHLRKAFTHAMLSVGKELAASGNSEKTATWLEKCLKIDPLAGELPAFLARCQSE